MRDKSRILILLAGVAILLLQLAKGLSLESALYPIATSVLDYADGPVRRGLLPSLYHALGFVTVPDLMVLYSRLHFVWLGLLAVLFLFLLYQRRGAGETDRRWLLLILLAGPLLPLLAAASGYADALLVSVLLLVSLALNARREGTAVLLVLLASLQHEMVLALSLPLFLALALLTPERRKPLLEAAFVIILVSVSWLAVTAAYQPQLHPLTVTRCEELRPASHPWVEKSWDIYCERQTRGDFASDFKPLRLILIPFYMLVYGLFPLLALLLSYGLIRREGRWSRVFLLPLMFAPWLLVTVAWDADRFIILGFLTIWMILDRWLQQTILPTPPGALRLFLWMLIGLQLALYVPAIDFYGARRLISPATEARGLIDPRSWTFPFMEKVGVSPTPQLDPANCIDLRCAKPVQ